MSRNDHSFSERDIDDHELDGLSDAQLDAELAATDPWLAPSLAHILAPPADLQRRTTSVVREGLLARSTVDTAVGMLSVGVQTLRLLFTPPSSQENTP